jgi:hypothetical protein
MNLKYLIRIFLKILVVEVLSLTLHMSKAIAFRDGREYDPDVSLSLCK